LRHSVLRPLLRKTKTTASVCGYDVILNTVGVAPPAAEIGCSLETWDRGGINV